MKSGFLTLGCDNKTNKTKQLEITASKEELAQLEGDLKNWKPKKIDRTRGIVSRSKDSRWTSTTKVTIHLLGDMQIKVKHSEW
jgi:hypothetical protein